MLRLTRGGSLSEAKTEKRACLKFGPFNFYLAA